MDLANSQHNFENYQNLVNSDPLQFAQARVSQQARVPYLVFSPTNSNNMSIILSNNNNIFTPRQEQLLQGEQLNLLSQ